MKIAIAGTRGIPNYYGGFEQCASILSVMLAQHGHEVIVYNSHDHPYKDKNYRGVTIRHCYNPEKIVGPAGNFVYDYLCMRDAVRSGAEVLLVLGYSTASLSYPLLNLKKIKLVTNMDGLEWKRGKFSPWVQKLTLHSEKLAVRYSDATISDNEFIRKHVVDRYGNESHYIAYGCDRALSPDENLLSKEGLSPFGFSLIVARLEDENNTEMILRAYTSSRETGPLLVIGGTGTPYAKKLLEKFGKDPRFVFKGGVYDKNMLDTLRYYAKFYFHGHSVGGTNPSLLEAMAARALIVAHDNVFNRSVTGHHAHFFTDADSLCKIIDNPDSRDLREVWAGDNLQKVTTQYQWELICDQYENLFISLTGKGSAVI